MSTTPKSFYGIWTIRWWGVTPVNEGEGLPADGFSVDGRLNVEETGDDSNELNLSWSDHEKRSCTMSLPFKEGTLDGQNVKVEFGDGPRVCKSIVVQEIGSKGDAFHFLVGLLSCPAPHGIGTGNAGAFVAQVEPGGSGGDGPRRARKQPRPRGTSKAKKAPRR